MLQIDNELFVYTGITGNKFTGVWRAQQYDPNNLISMDQINYLYIHTKLLTMVTNGDFNALMW